MKNDLVSVIIPAYNAESRIKFTIESIIAQDYENLEIILVNDVSSDNTCEIAKISLASSGRSYKIINHAKNMGECASRNTGLENSSGKYIAFVDADDLIERNFISCLHEKITQDHSDIAFCGFIDRFEDNRPDKNFHSVKNSSFTASNGEDFILARAIPAVWSCMYDKSFLEKYNLKFLEGCTAGGDVDFTTRAFCRAKKVSFTEKCLYIYMHHSEMGSVRDNNTREKKIKRYEDNTDAHISTANYLAENSRSEKVKYLAEKILKPQYIIRQANIFAMKHDKISYYALINNSEKRKILRDSQRLRVLVKKAEVFAKAFMLLHMPKFYYMLRSK